MTNLEIPVNEKKRIAALNKYAILDTPPDGAFDRITNLASAIFNVPIAIISLVDTDRIWFKSHHGLPVNQIDREPGLCASAILSNDIYAVENAAQDPRTLTNSLVAGDFGLRFYAAAPLQTEENYNLGTLCIIDKTPRTFSDADKEKLRQLASIVMDEMEMRLIIRNTVAKIKNLALDISTHLNDTIKSIDSGPDEDKSENLRSHLEASRMFLMNVENQLDQL